MKKIIAFLISLFVTCGISAQDSAFVRTYGGTSMDVARDVKETPDQGFIVAGTTSSFGQGDASMYLVKTDSMGIHQWSKNYGGLYSDCAYTAEVTLDGGYLLAGFSNSFSGNYDGYVVRTDASGNQLWEKTYGTTDWDLIYGSALLPDSGYVFCGNTYGNAIGGSDGYVIRTDKDGNQIWAVNVGTVEDDNINKIIYLDGYLYAVGSTTVSGHKYGMLVRIDLSGSYSTPLIYNFNPNANQEFMCVTHNSLNNLVLGGYVNPDTTSNLNDWLVIMDTLGNVSYNGSGTSTGVKRFDGVVCIDGDQIVTVGANNGGNGGIGLFMVRFDANGSYLAADNFGGVEDDFGYGVTLTANKHLAFVGSTYSSGCGDQDMYFIMNRNEYFVSNSKLNTKQFCDTLGLVVVGIEENYTVGRQVKIYPNPFKDQINVFMGNDIIGTENEFIMTDLTGRLVFAAPAAAGVNNFKIDRLEQGVYFCFIKSQQGLINCGKLLHQ